MRYLHRVSTDESNTLLKNQGKALVKVTYWRIRVTTFGAEVENQAAFPQFLTSRTVCSLNKIMPIVY